MAAAANFVGRRKTPAFGGRALAGSVGERSLRFTPRVRVALAASALLTLVYTSALHSQTQIPRVEIVPSAATNSGNDPLRWSGLLLNYAAEMDGHKRHVICTAQFIAPRVVLTAAHCVQDFKTGAWYDVDKMYFVLQYSKGSFSDIYRPVCLSRYDGWFPDTGKSVGEAETTRSALARYQWDYAMILMDHDGPDGFFNSEVDWKGKYQTATMIGYPLAPLADLTVQTARGPLYFPPDRPNVVALVHMNRQDLTRGTSGGGWMVNIHKESGGQRSGLVSISSYINEQSPGVSFGPYLTSDYNKLLDYVSNGCPY